MTIDNKQRAAAPVQALLGRKFGMTQVWDADGCLVSLTVMQIDTNAVTRARIEEVDGYNAIRLGLGETPVRKVTKPMAGRLAGADVEPCRHLVEVRTSAASNCELGQELQATVFKAGQAVDVSGNTEGKDFAGVMKCHGFVGVSANHGACRNHRKPGSIDARVTPGRIFKGLRMAGRMGDVRRTVQSLRIQAVDVKKGLLFVSGTVPGPKNGMVPVRSSVKGV